jgi:triosephosphate isomerase (TIM)
MRTVTDHPATETVPGDDFEARLDGRRSIRVPFFEIGPKNMLRRPELHKLLAVAQSHSQQYGVSLIATLPVTEIEPASLLFPDIHLFAQHMDPDMPGPSVGRVIAEALTDAGANGVMLNHADHQMPLDQVAVAVDRAKANGLLTLACAADEREAASIAALSPDILLYEPRAMIGHSGGARRPWIPQINALVRPIAPHTHIMHAGGVATPEDARNVIKAGAMGTGATSAIVNARDHSGIIEGFLSAVREAWDDTPNLRVNGAVADGNPVNSLEHEP